MPTVVASLFAVLPPTAARPSGGVIAAALVFLLVVVGFNALWETFKGPPAP